jgi:hypothetical protein
VIKKTWKKDHPSDKLDYPLAGPFRIIKMMGHSYQLDLPPSYKIWPIFHADRLRKDPGNPLPGQSNPEPDPMEIDCDCLAFSLGHGAVEMSFIKRWARRRRECDALGDEFIE